MALLSLTHRSHYIYILLLTLCVSPALALSNSQLGGNGDSPLPASIYARTPLLGLSSTPLSHPQSSEPPPYGPSPSDPPAQDNGDLSIVYQRRLTTIISGVQNSSSIPAWRSTLDDEGKWPDSEIDYTSGCTARRANWPAQVHWIRIRTMAAAWHGDVPSSAQFARNTDLRNAISSAMEYWFHNDFKNLDCLDRGGKPACPCGTPGFWNTNWFSNIILIPRLVTDACLLLNDTLSNDELEGCTRFSSRSYGTFGRQINGVGTLTGANALDVAKIGIDLGLLTTNVTLVAGAYGRVHAEMIVENEVFADGIRADGSFGQHAGLLYNGNYGKDYTNDILDLETAAGGTQFSAGEQPRSAFAKLFDGHQWMIFRNTLTGILHWDFSVIPRFTSFPVADDQATASIKMNLTEVMELGKQWNSVELMDIAVHLQKSTQDANAGRLFGNRMFYANDYMVHRGKGFVTTVKMFSTRTKNTECINSQNPLGFHLADGAVYTYLQGNEYEDITASWDWNRIPGITSDGKTPLSCDQAQFVGLESFVGGASDGRIGLAAMRYANPRGGPLRWQKTWFFFDEDVQHVMISGLKADNDDASTVFSVLDQRRRAGDVFVNGVASGNAQKRDSTSPETLWHGGVGYVFGSSDGSNKAIELQLVTGDQTGNWAAIGTSTQPPTTVDLFEASLKHHTLDPVAYTVYPGTSSYEAFAHKRDATRVRTVRNDASVSAAFDESARVAMVVFWDRTGGSVAFANPGSSPFMINSDSNVAVIYAVNSGEVTVSDPSQTLSAVKLTFSHESGEGQGGRIRRTRELNGKKEVMFEMPTGGVAGSSVTQNIMWN